MNELPAQIKTQVFTNKNEYLSLRAHWSQLMNSERKHELAAAHHLLYTALIGRDWRKGFTPPKNQRKLDNGAFDGWELFRALRQIHSPYSDAWLLAPFENFVTPIMILRLRQILPKTQPYQCKIEAFVNGRFPFPAFDISIELAASNSKGEASME